jgi:hypothetical protein
LLQSLSTIHEEKAVDKMFAAMIIATAVLCYG